MNTKIEREEAKREEHRARVAKLYPEAIKIRSEECWVGLMPCDLELWRHGRRYYITEKQPNGYLHLHGESSSFDAAMNAFVNYYYYLLEN